MAPYSSLRALYMPQFLPSVFDCSVNFHFLLPPISHYGPIKHPMFLFIWSHMTPYSLHLAPFSPPLAPVIPLYHPFAPFGPLWLCLASVGFDWPLLAFIDPGLWLCSCIMLKRNKTIADICIPIFSIQLMQLLTNSVLVY